MRSKWALEGQAERPKSKAMFTVRTSPLIIICSEPLCLCKPCSNWRLMSCREKKEKKKDSSKVSVQLLPIPCWVHSNEVAGYSWRGALLSPLLRSWAPLWSQAAAPTTGQKRGVGWNGGWAPLGVVRMQLVILTFKNKTKPCSTAEWIECRDLFAEHYTLKS